MIRDYRPGCSASDMSQRQVAYLGRRPCRRSRCSCPPVSCCIDLGRCSGHTCETGRSECTPHIHKERACKSACSPRGAGLAPPTHHISMSVKFLTALRSMESWGRRPPQQRWRRKRLYQVMVLVCSDMVNCGLGLGNSSISDFPRGVTCLLPAVCCACSFPAAADIGEALRLLMLPPCSAPPGSSMSTRGRGVLHMACSVERLTGRPRPIPPRSREKCRD